MWMLVPNPEFTMKTFKRLGFLPEDVFFTGICQSKILIFSLKFCLMKTRYYINCAEYTVVPYSLRPRARAHNCELPVANPVMKKNYY